MISFSWRRQSKKLEFISPDGLRIDGRRAGELRKIAIKLGYFPNADGSVLLEQVRAVLFDSVACSCCCVSRGIAVL